jgi:hypothetical protein
MSSSVSGNERHAKALRAWQLAILRLAVTLDNADRLAVLTIARELDNLAPQHAGKPDFGFFHRTSRELCIAILQPNELTCTVLRQYLTRIDDDRVKRAFAAAMEVDQPKPSSFSTADNRDNGLWKGLSSRTTAYSTTHLRNPGDIPRLTRPKAG